MPAWVMTLRPRPSQEFHNEETDAEAAEAAKVFDEGPIESCDGDEETNMCEDDDAGSTKRAKSHVNMADSESSQVFL